ncbi:MAG: hypothetical protein RIE52_00460 [Balneola sp.]|jgi:hypothetical protein
MPEIRIGLMEYACNNDPDSCPAYTAGREGNLVRKLNVSGSRGGHAQALMTD